MSAQETQPAEMNPTPEYTEPEVAMSSVAEESAEVEYVEKIVEVPEVKIQEKIKYVKKIEVQECVVEVPKIVYKEKIVEVPEVEYIEVPVERIVEVPEVREEIVLKEVPVPQYVEKPVPVYVRKEVPNDIQRIIPVPVKSESVYKVAMPKLTPKRRVVKVPMYVPQFVEVPVPVELLDEESVANVEQLSAQIRALAEQEAPSLHDIEKLAEFAKNNDFLSNLKSENLERAVTDAFKRGRLNVTAPVAQ